MPNQRKSRIHRIDQQRIFSCGATLLGVPIRLAPAPASWARASFVMWIYQSA